MTKLVFASHIFVLSMIDKFIIGVEGTGQINQLRDAIKKYRYISYPKYLNSSDINLINPNNWKTKK